MIPSASRLSPTRPALEIQSRLRRAGARLIAGHVYAPADLDSRFVVELFLDGFPVDLARATLCEAELRDLGVGDGCYGFRFVLAPEALGAAVMAEVRLANHGAPLDAPLRLDAFAGEGEAAEASGDVRWGGGLRLEGWLSYDGLARTPFVRAEIDGVTVAEVAAGGWRQSPHGMAAARAFELHLPAELADGRVRRARVFDETGFELPGSPCAFVAFADGLRRFLEARAELKSEVPRGRMYDLLFPQSWPLWDYAAWAEAFPAPAPGAPATGNAAVVLLGEAGLEASLTSLARQQGCEWIATTLSGDAASTGPLARLGAFLAEEAAQADWIVFAPCGTQFAPPALARLAEALTAFPRAALAYGDLEIADAQGGLWPLAFGAFDYERMLEQGYAALVFAARRAFVEAAANRGVDEPFRLFLAACEGDPARRRDAVVHLPGVVARLAPPDVAALAPQLAQAVQAHMAARGVRAQAHAALGVALPRARLRRTPDTGRISVVVPTRDRIDLLQPCLDALRATVAGEDLDIVVVDNDSSDPASFDYFADIAREGVRIARVSGAFNFARLVNAGASIADGELLLTLNNDVEAFEPGWLAEMRGRLVEPDVGAVGALLLWPSGATQHGGVTLGPDFSAGHAFRDRREGDAGYGDLLLAAHETSAVTAACLLTRRALFRELGGFDALRYPVDFNDVDFCLRLRARGLRVVMTPHAKLRHRQSSSRGDYSRPDAADGLRRALDNLRADWGETLIADPAYSPLLALDGPPYAALAWPPRAMTPRLPAVAPPRRPSPVG